ncbi:MAG: hypothetical protein LBO74_17040 [Candidatus Symbiothrix sp.]|jgi:hypothetical protein|nr:hypothetical protein [Candidatus Symbiothrix sp.]
MKKKKFYRFLLKYNKNHGVLFAPKGTDIRFGVEVEPVVNWENIEFTLKGGVYLPFMNSNTTAYFANEELKNLIQEIIPADYPLEFYPIKTKSEEYGNKIYYLIHFKVIFDVIDTENSVWVVDSIAKPWIDYEKAKDLDFFNASNAINEIMVSDLMKRMMQKNKLDIGIEFKEVPYIS